MPRTFPRRQVRDALGLVRLLWTATPRRRDSERYALERAGQALVAALHDPAHPDAQRLAVVAMESLEAVGWATEVQQLVREATERVRGRPRTGREERESGRRRRG